MGVWRVAAGAGVALFSLPLIFSPKREIERGLPYQFLPRTVSYLDQPNKSFLSVNPVRVGVLGGDIAGCIAGKTLLQQGYRVQIIGAETDTQEHCAIPDLATEATESGKCAERYVRQFGFEDRLTSNCVVTAVSQFPDGKWTVGTTKGDLEFDFLIIASAFRPVSNSSFPGAEHFTGAVLHPADLPAACEFLSEKQVAVIGSQTSAQSSIFQLCHSGARVICVLPEKEPVRQTSWVSELLRDRRLGEKQETGGIVWNAVWTATDATFTALHNLSVPAMCKVDSFAAAQLNSYQTEDYRALIDSGKLRFVHGPIVAAGRNNIDTKTHTIHCDAVFLCASQLPDSFSLLPADEPASDLYRSTIKPGLRNAAFIGFTASPWRTLICSLQAKWLLDVFRGRIVLPSEEFMRKNQNPEEKGTYEVADELLTDCGIRKYRKDSWAREWLQPIRATDYRQVLTHSS